LVHACEIAEKYLAATLLAFALIAPLRTIPHGTWRWSATRTPSHCIHITYAVARHGM